MERELVDNKNKQRILAALARQPSRFFSIKELSLRTGMSQQRVKKILARFAKRDIVNTWEKKQERYFQINRYSTVFSDLLSVLGIEKHHERPVVEKLILAIGDLKFAALSGIFTGSAKAEVDLLLVGQPRIKKAEKIIREIEKIVGNEINYTILSEKEFTERISSFDWFLKEIMEKEPVVLIDKTSRSKKEKAGSRVAMFFSNVKKKK